MAACQKSPENPDPVDPVIPSCKITSETSDRPADPGSLEYSYGPDGLLATILKKGSSQEAIDTLHIENDHVLRTDTDGDWLRYDYASPIRVTTIATPATGTMTPHGTSGTEADRLEFVYSYDDRKRLIKISETSPDLEGDYEWDLLISYNDQDNVSSLKVAFTSGPPVSVNIQVTGYDDHPTPYINIPNYRFFMNKYHWNSPDLEPLITALSRNNPTGYTVAGAIGLTSASMTYTYTEEGFPATRTTTQINNGSSSSFRQAFGYTCE